MLATSRIDGGHNRTTIKGFYGAGQEDTSRTEPFVVDAGEPPVLLGDNEAPNAPEYLLHALAACLTGTIVYHAAARGIALDGLECTIEGDVDLHGFLGLDENVRPGYEGIRVAFKASGDFDDEQLAELASLTSYSPVRDIVSQPRPRGDRRSPRVSGSTHDVRASRFGRRGRPASVRRRRKIGPTCRPQ